MTPLDIEAILKRIERAIAAVQIASAVGYESSYQAEGTDFTTHFRAVGLKAPEQLEDDFLNVFIWMWNLKDYLKACYEANGLRGSAVEEEVNHCQALSYVADIANRAKHGVLRESRSGEFAELTDVGFDVPQESIGIISIAGPGVTLSVNDPQMIQIHATVVTKAGVRLDALNVLNEAMQCWESNVLGKMRHDPSFSDT